MRKKIKLINADVTEVSLAFSKEEQDDLDDAFGGLEIEVSMDDTFFIEHEDESKVRKFVSFLRKNKINFEEDTFPLQAFNP